MSKPVDALTLVLLALLATAACSEPLELADWRLPIPDGTPIKEYAPTALEDRDPEAVRLIDDLVIGGESDDPNGLFYRPSSVVAADSGTIYVADNGNKRIQVFGPDGAYIRALGREGQGPGEFASLWRMTIAGDSLVVYDNMMRRISVWTLDGEHVDDHLLGSSHFLMSVQGLAGGDFISNLLDERGAQPSFAVARHAISGAELSRLVEVATGPPFVIRSGRMTAKEIVLGGIARLDYPQLLEAVGARRTVFVSPGLEYQVLALSERDEALWALRVAWPRPPMPQTEKESRIDRARRSGSGAASVDDFDWPPYKAVESLGTDGAGNLYVFPTMPVEGDEPPELRPVDVYSPAGELLAAGVVPRTWGYALGDYAYGLRRDEREEMVVVRYRLLLAEG